MLPAAVTPPGAAACPESTPALGAVTPPRAAACPESTPVVGLDAIVLAGGRSSRLGGTSKATLLHAGRTLVEHALETAAEAGAARIVLVGAPDSLPPRHRLDAAAAPATLLLTREHPPYSGPAAALAAALDVLSPPMPAPAPVPAPEPPPVRASAFAPRPPLPPASESAPASASDAGASAGDPSRGAFTLVLACDQPRAALAVPHLVAAAVGDSEKGRSASASGLFPAETHAGLPFSAAPRDESGHQEERGREGEREQVREGAVSGWVAVDAGRAQPLLAVFRTTALVEAVGACAAERAGATLEGAPMRQLLAHLVLAEVPVPAGSAADVDTWDAAARLGVTRPDHGAGEFAAARSSEGDTHLITAVHSVRSDTHVAAALEGGETGAGGARDIEVFGEETA